MARKGRRNGKICGSDGIRHLDEIERGVRIVRDAGDGAVKASWKFLEGRWGDVARVADSVGSRCVKLSLVGVSIRVPQLDGPEKQVRCPSDPALRCSGCIVDAAFRSGFPTEQLGDIFAQACGKNVSSGCQPGDVKGE